MNHLHQKLIQNYQFYYQLDLDILKQDWSRTDKPPSDLNQDGIVDSRDLWIMKGEWSK